MSRNRNNYPFHNAPVGASDRSLLVNALLKDARQNRAKRAWRKWFWRIVAVVGSILFTVVFFYLATGDIRW